MIFRKLSEREFDLVKGRGHKSVKEVLGLHKECMSGLERVEKVVDVQKTIDEVLFKDER